MKKLISDIGKSISDIELTKYVSGQLSTEETKALYEKALENGETDLLLHIELASLEMEDEEMEDNSSCQLDNEKEWMPLIEKLLDEQDAKDKQADTRWAIAARFPLKDKDNK